MRFKYLILNEIDFKLLYLSRNSKIHSKTNTIARSQLCYAILNFMTSRNCSMVMSLSILTSAANDNRARSHYTYMYYISVRMSSLPIRQGDIRLHWQEIHHNVSLHTTELNGRQYQLLSVRCNLCSNPRNESNGLVNKIMLVL